MTIQRRPISDYSLDYRGSILQSPPLALAITHERAYIWDYTSTTPVTQPRTFDVTQPTKSTDALPIGALVTNSNTKAIGLLIVSSTTGRITYWENIETAESLSLFQQRNTGIEGNIGSLFSGEEVVDLTSADHVGFVITLSSGRIAQITLADQQGKPKITAHFLRSNDAAGRGGIFGSIKSTFGLGAWKRDVVAVHTRPLGARREMQVVAATENAQIQVWDLSWSGQHAYKGNFDFTEMLQHHINQYNPSPLPRDRVVVKVLDMAVNPPQVQGDEMASSKTDTPLDVMLLIQSADRVVLGPSYYIANLVMFGQDARMDRLIPIRTEITSMPGEQRPHLLLPKPGHTAYVVSEQQIIFCSLVAGADDGPEAQLMFESPADPPLFQDSLWLRTAKHLAIEDCSEENIVDNSGASACAVFVKGYGLARITANNPISTTRSRPTAKSMIEQAIFYGTMPDNIFDLSRHAKADDQYDMEDIEMAALRISNEILRSSTPYIPTTTTTLDAQLASRMRACQALIMYLTKNYPAIPKATRARLMADAEKLAAAYAIWTTYNSKLSEVPRPSFLPLLVQTLDKLSQKQSKGVQKAPKSSQPVDTDPVRQWFISNAESMGSMRTMILTAVSGVYEGKNHNSLLRYISEADDILFGMYDAVFAFRTNNAELYGFNYAAMAEGILEEGYEDLPEPWTSNHDVFNAFNKFIDVARDFTVDSVDKSKDALTSAILEKVVQDNVRLVAIMCMLYRERIAYVSVHYGERGPQYPESLAQGFAQARAHHLGLLSTIGQAGAGIVIAERYHDLETLVKLVVSESDYLQVLISDPDLNPHQAKLIHERIFELEACVQRYFQEMGADWANAYFDAHLKDHRSYGLLLEAKKYREPLTTYLRAEKSRGRVGWIHDVLRENNYEEGSKALSALAREQENKIWNKKMELSLGKLASLAVQEEKGGAANKAIDIQLQHQEDDLTIVDIQQSIKTSFESILFAAVDVEAEVQLVSDAYAITMKRRLPAFYNLIEIALEDMLQHKVLGTERLIDVLTLLDPEPPEVPETDVTGTQFYLALQVLKAAKKDLDAEKFDVLLRLIWKRCWLSDDWETINDSKRKSDKFIGRELRETIICKTVALGLKNCKSRLLFLLAQYTDFVAALFAPGTGITLISPTETLGAGCAREDIAYRFHVDDLINPILHDNTVQDNQMRQTIEQRRLEHWWVLLQEEAKKVLEEQAAADKAEGEAGKNLAAELEAREQARRKSSLVDEEAQGQDQADSRDVIVIDDDSEEEGQNGGEDVDMS